jgi:hypothetical protein
MHAVHAVLRTPYSVLRAPYFILHLHMHSMFPCYAFNVPYASGNMQLPASLKSKFLLLSPSSTPYSIFFSRPLFTGKSSQVFEDKYSEKQNKYRKRGCEGTGAIIAHFEIDRSLCTVLQHCSHRHRPLLRSPSAASHRPRLCPRCWPFRFFSPSHSISRISTTQTEL